MTDTAFNFDFSQDKPDLREPIPAGVPLFLRFNYTPSGFGPNGAATKGKPKDDGSFTLYLKGEFTVQRGPFKGRKFFSNMTIAGGEVDEKGQSKAATITRKNIRHMLDSANGLSIKDETPAACAKRVLANGFASMQGMCFMATAKIEPAQNGYPAKNGLGTILTIDDDKYPKNETDLDNPVLPQQAVKPALPTIQAPSWAAPQTATTETPAVTASPPAALPQVEQQPIGQDPAQNGYPAWMTKAA